MSEAKFTPGPWLLRKVPDYDQHEIGLSDFGIGEKCLSGMRPDVPGRYMLVTGCIDAHDASLIAAAPCLYEALQKLANATRGWDVDAIISEADAALAKARGET